MWFWRYIFLAHFLMCGDYGYAWLYKYIKRNTLINLWRSLSLSIADDNACQSSQVFSTTRGYLKCAVVHHHRIIYFCSMLLCSFCWTVDSLFWLISKIGLYFSLLSALQLTGIKYTGHHNACVIRLLLGQ